jgi:RNA polymerase sigma-70 factor (ECF subfamily)
MSRSATLFLVPPLGISMSTPNIDRLWQGRPSSEQPARQEVVESGDPRPESGEIRPADAPLGAQRTALTSADLDRLAVQAALRGDQAAFADLVTRYQSAVYNLAYRMLGDPTEAEDAAQEVFVRAWNQLHTFQPERRFSTWLLSIASHYCIDLLRRRKPSAPLDDVALYVPSDAAGPDELALQGEQREIVQRLLATLPEKYRSVTVLRYYNDLSYDEIARMTGLSESAVKTQLHRARRMLAEQMLVQQLMEAQQTEERGTRRSEAPASQPATITTTKGGASNGV